MGQWMCVCACTDAYCRLLEVTLLVLSGLLLGPLLVTDIYVLKLYLSRSWSHTLVLIYCKRNISKGIYLL